MKFYNCVRRLECQQCEEIRFVDGMLSLLLSLLCLIVIFVAVIVVVTQLPVYSSGVVCVRLGFDKI